MNYRIRKAAVSLLAAGMTLSWAAIPVLGSAEAIVEDVSDDAAGHATATDDDTLSIENKNFGKVDNSDSSTAETGDNHISGDDGNSISTAGAGAGALSDNFLNSNFTSVSDEGESAHATVRRISDDALGTAEASDDDLLSVLNENCWKWSWWVWKFCKVDNSTSALADTGDNTISGEDDNSISTGPAQADALALNVMNTNETEVSGWGHSATALVEDVSDDAAGHATASDEDTLSVENKNFGKIDNSTTATAETGDNHISGDDRNSIGTGGATALAGSANFLNTNETSVSGGEGEGGSADATVSGVSDDALGTAEASDDDLTSVENTNKGKVDNSTSATADSGDNTISGEDDNSISSGDASAGSSSSNTVNTNVTTISM